MLLDGGGPARELQNLGVGEHRGRLLRARGGDVARRLLARRVDHLERLRADPLLDDGAEPRIADQRLEDLVLVWVDLALHDVLAEAPAGIDDDDLVEARLGVDREHHAGAADVGAHHLLHADRHRDLEVIEALGSAVADRAVGEHRGVAALAGLEQRVFAGDVQERFELAGEARLRQVLSGGAGAHRDARGGNADALRERAIGAADRLGDVVRPRAAPEGAPDRLARLGERGAAGRERAQLAFDQFAQPVFLDEGPIGVGARGETRRHGDALGGEVPHQLPERRILAADRGHVVPGEVFEPGDRVSFHGTDPRIAGKMCRGPCGCPLPCGKNARGLWCLRRRGAAMTQVNARRRHGR